MCMVMRRMRRGARFELGLMQFDGAAFVSFSFENGPRMARPTAADRQLFELIYGGRQRRGSRASLPGGGQYRKQKSQFST